MDFNVVFSQFDSETNGTHKVVNFAHLAHLMSLHYLVIGSIVPLKLRPYDAIQICLLLYYY